MGAIDIEVTMRGSSLKDAFNKAQAIAREENGTDYYNGTIYNCELIGDKTSGYKEAKDKSKFIQDLQSRVNKGECVGVCIKEPKPNINKVKSVVERIPQKGKRIYKAFYVVYERMGEEKEVSKCVTQKLAIINAREYTEKNAISTSIYFERKLIQGNSLCATIKYKPSKTESEGLYTFIGVSPY